ncbi:hypothetical protein WJX74_009632 [Apatococcus lobatus]|uniref:VanZ-like domain-containing protein n=1 Tax=Apatococcus lobatus TaxID=904363 RepID=A0AAW1RFL2_9CHLO
MNCQVQEPFITPNRKSLSILQATLAASGDSWFQLDKVEHFLLCLILTILVYLLAGFQVFRPGNPTKRLLCSATLSFGAGLLKELGDYVHWWPGQLSLKDLLADLTGTLFGLTIILGHQAFSPHQKQRIPSPGDP